MSNTTVFKKKKIVNSLQMPVPNYCKALVHSSKELYVRTMSLLVKIMHFVLTIQQSALLYFQMILLKPIRTRGVGKYN